VKSVSKAALLLILVLVCAWPIAARQSSSTGGAQTAMAATTTTRGALPAQANNTQTVIEGKVVKVSDGDTITVLDKENRQIKIRFQGIDAPESKQEFGQASKENLAGMIFGRQVTVIWSKQDKYGRTVGKVLLDGRDINIEQVKAGLAWHYRKYETEQPPEDRVTYAAAEREARAAKRGLWQDPNPTPPGEWRAESKTERWGPAPPEGTVIGNKSNKKYHRPDCPGYRDMAERNRVFFKSVEEAEAAGYKRAGNCPAEIIQNATAKPAYSTTATNATQASAATPATSSAAAAAAAPAPTPVAAPVAASASAQSTPPTDATPAAAAAPIIGNKNSKIYHRPDCPGYKNVSEKNQVKFNTVEEAEQAGYRAAKNCPAPK
jgi:endonuclease YncB( thermonuclease family)/methylphosphotriester-DNA--protein-cysteine methyltransferase